MLSVLIEKTSLLLFVVDEEVGKKKTTHFDFTGTGLVSARLQYTGVTVYRLKICTASS